ncbi:hypothetical protein BDY21DRAFT_171735 [Lineolata rhizophorae]|uniref:Uncharacterized protein n=1 Tax=Lineolata rhizophorae TaxID=578093 RepID=A0A6A6P9Y4_9PEZI|nr:hypothetical protein BDY21DRAFT_171735 [Lineolata rhizophorae]
MAAASAISVEQHVDNQHNNYEDNESSFGALPCATDLIFDNAVYEREVLQLPEGKTEHDLDHQLALHAYQHRHNRAYSRSHSHTHTQSSQSPADDDQSRISIDPGLDASTAVSTLTISSRASSSLDSPPVYKPSHSTARSFGTSTATASRPYIEVDPYLLARGAEDLDEESPTPFIFAAEEAGFGALDDTLHVIAGVAGELKMPPSTTAKAVPGAGRECTAVDGRSEGIRAGSPKGSRIKRKLGSMGFLSRLRRDGSKAEPPPGLVPPRPSLTTSQPILLPTRPSRKNTGLTHRSTRSFRTSSSLTPSSPASPTITPLSLKHLLDDEQFAAVWREQSAEALRFARFEQKQRRALARHYDRMMAQEKARGERERRELEAQVSCQHP